MTKLFIVLDGIDGNGKTIQAILLKEWLEQKNLKVFQTSQPTESEHGKKIENLLRRRGASKVPKEKWLEFFTLDSKENQAKILGALEQDLIVICDRYMYSTLTYQLEEKEWQTYAEQFLKPSIAFILDVPAEIALERIKEKCESSGEKKACFEKLGFLKETRKKFLMLPQFLQHNIKIIEGTRTKEVIFEDIKKEIELLIKDKT
jgi:dTMP kinase